MLKVFLNYNKNSRTMPDTAMAGRGHGERFSGRGGGGRGRGGQDAGVKGEVAQEV